MTHVPEQPHILVVDDDPIVLAVMERILRDYPLVTGESVAGGLAALQSEPRIALAVLDKNLPDGEGPQLAAAIRRIRPGLPILIFSGDPPGSEDLADADGFVRKPVDPTVLRDHVARLLAARIVS